MKYKLVSNYKDNDFLRQSFDRLAKNTFGISFEDWYQKGLRGDNYICYSFREKDRIISNVSITKMRLKTRGNEKKLIQIGTVMTDRDYRGKGLAKELMDYVINKYEDDYRAFYLFANSNVLDFYPKFGFEKASRLQLFTEDKVAGDIKREYRKLDIYNKKDLKILINLAKDRHPTSDRFYFVNNEEILCWYCLGFFKDYLYYNSEEEIIVIYAIEGETLHLYDVISRRDISYRELLSNIQSVDIKETVFHFNLDKDDVNIKTRVFDDMKEDDPMFIRGDLNMGDVTYPVTAHT